MVQAPAAPGRGQGPSGGVPPWSELRVGCAVIAVLVVLLVVFLIVSGGPLRQQLREDREPPPPLAPGQTP